MGDRPNILLITADQLRWDALGCMGNGVVRTPHLDALAARGMLFRNGFTPTPICVPARACIMTGNYPHVCTGRKTNGGRIKDGQPLLTETLKREGYRTYAMGKLHFVPYSPPGAPRLVHGFEHVDLCESGRILGQFDPKGEREGLEDYIDYLKTVGWGGYSRAHGCGNNDCRPCPSPLPAEHYVDHWIADCTIRQIDLHAREAGERPFFMWMSTPKPHAPLDPPRPYDALYDPRSIPVPPGRDADKTVRNGFIEHRYYTHALASLSPEAWQVARSYYYGCITFMDAMIGRVIERLERTGLYDKTLVLFTADHGDMLGDFGTAGKAIHQNGSVRVPFLASGPGVARGVSDALVGLQDILPTFAAAAGATRPDVQGIDLTPALADPSRGVRDTYYATVDNGCGQTAMLTDGRWKYIYSEGGPLEELYDQVADPAELNNLAGDAGQKARVGDMRAALRKCAGEFGDHALLAGDGLAAKPLDRSGFPKLPVSGIGWRWY